MLSRKLGVFLVFFSLGIWGGWMLSNLSNSVFAFLWEGSLVDGIVVVGIFAIEFLALLFLTSFGSLEKSTKFRISLLGISVAAFLGSAYRLFQFADGGIPFHSLLWSLFLGSLFAAIERLISIWERLSV